MGLLFLPIGMKLVTKSMGSKKSTSVESTGDSKSKSTRSRRPKLLSLLRRRGAETKAPATPHNTFPTAFTPATAPMHNRVDTVSKPKSFQLQYHDTVTQTLLEEQERIRQQLFYEDESVEVSAQFREPSSVDSSERKQKFKHRFGRLRREDEEEKKEDSLNSSMISETIVVGTPIKKKNEEWLPPTPELDPTESGPLQVFPTVSEAAATAKEEQVQHYASLISMSMSEDSSSVTPQSKVSVSFQSAVTPSPEKPFDEVHMGPEDPTIMELENLLSLDESEYAGEALKGKAAAGMSEPGSSAMAGVSYSTNAETTRSPDTCSSRPDPQQLLSVFQCGNDFTEFSGSAMLPHQPKSPRSPGSFYDSTCWTYQDAVTMNRPFYDENFAQKFLKDITQDGITVVWHLPPDDAGDEGGNWSGRSVVMKIKPGSCYSNNDVEPKLIWTTVGGPKTDKVARCLVPLLAIQSVATFRETISERDARGNEIKEEEFTNTTRGVNLSRMDDDEDVCLFAITTQKGDVQVFEATTPTERDLFVAGLKNVMARLTFHVILGDTDGASDLYYDEDQDIPMGELPLIASRSKNMNRIAHSLMD